MFAPSWINAMPGLVSPHIAEGKSLSNPTQPFGGLGVLKAGGELMFKKLGLATFLISAGLALVSPNAAQARDRENEHHRHRFSVVIGVGPRHYADGYYDRWGYWHPYGRGYYDRRGYWHARW